jgi:hypothetical protein
MNDPDCSLNRSLSSYVAMLPRSRVVCQYVLAERHDSDSDNHQFTIRHIPKGVIARLLTDELAIHWIGPHGHTRSNSNRLVLSPHSAIGDNMPGLVPLQGTGSMGQTSPRARTRSRTGESRGTAFSTPSSRTHLAGRRCTVASPALNVLEVYWEELGAPESLMGGATAPSPTNQYPAAATWVHLGRRGNGW